MANDEFDNRRTDDEMRRRLLATEETEIEGGRYVHASSFDVDSFKHTPSSLRPLVIVVSGPDRDGDICLLSHNEVYLPRATALALCRELLKRLTVIDVGASIQDSVLVDLLRDFTKDAENELLVEQYHQLQRQLGTIIRVMRANPRHTVGVYADELASWIQVGFDLSAKVPEPAGALPATELGQLAEQYRQERDVLGTAIVELAKQAGITTVNVQPLNGPEILLLARELGRVIEQGQDIQRALDDALSQDTTLTLTDLLARIGAALRKQH
jgi:hypothetical protein